MLRLVPTTPGHASRAVVLCLGIAMIARTGQALAQPVSQAPVAQAAQAGTPTAAGEGPALPPLPETGVHDRDGRATVRAVRVTTPMRMDGRLDEAVYEEVRPISDFIQMEPRAGQPATEKTEVWLLYDRNNLYVTFKAWESQPDRLVANELRRDSGNIRQGDSVGFSFDTFHDRRNAIQFESNALGARTDGQSSNERQYNADWNPVWRVSAGRFEGGWTIEAYIPFKSIRYAPGRTQVWGFQARRTNKWKNEIAYLTKIPNAFGMGRADFSASLYATMVGLEVPNLSRTLELKPFTVADVITDHVSTPARVGDVTADVGLDARYAITQNVSADITVNTDFAQVEADEQQVNLTRFSLFFPEKRDFFLENQGIFSFGNTTSGANQASDVPIAFYSRRIGLAQGALGPLDVPILAGGRVTGRVGRYQLGFVNMQTREDATANARPTNFLIARVRRDFLRRSSIGVLATNRSESQLAPGTSNQFFGVDGNFAFYNNLLFNTYWARTRSEGVDSLETSYRAQMDYSGDRYGLQLERLNVDPNFLPEVGFMRRTDMRKNFGLARFSPRPRGNRRIRKYFYVGQFTYIEDSAGRLSTRLSDAEFDIELQSSDRLSVGVVNDYEHILRPFNVANIRIPAGSYQFTTGRLGYTFGQQRPVSGAVLYEQGEFYDGTRRALTFNRARVNLSSRLQLEPSVTLNWIDVPAGQATTKLVSSRITYTMTPLMFGSALVQYNSTTNTLSVNARLRWEYHLGSELFVVYNEERFSDTTGIATPALQNRSFIVKVNRFFRF